MTRNTFMLCAAILWFSSCTGQEQKPPVMAMPSTTPLLEGDTVNQIDGEIRGITQDSKNNLWFASNGSGVFKYDGKTIVNYTQKHGLSSDYVWMVKEAKDGKIWFKTNVRATDLDAICCYDGYVFKTVSSATNATSYDFNKGELLFDYYFDGKSLSKIQLPRTSPIKNDLNQRHHYDIYSTCRDRQGNTWFGTCSAGICKYDGNNYAWFDDAELGAAVRDIYEDKQGTIWAGNNGDGLFRYNGKRFINFSREKNLHNPDFEKYPIGKPGLMSRVWKITADYQGNLWVATIDNGVWKYDGKTIMNYTEKDGLSLEGVGIWTVFTDKKGSLWLGTEGDGVYTYDGKIFQKFKR